MGLILVISCDLNTKFTENTFYYGFLRVLLILEGVAKVTRVPQVFSG